MPSGEIRAEGDSYKVEPGAEEVHLRITLRHFTKLYWTLLHDVEQAFHDADEAAQADQLELTRRARRNAARALFAWIEATVWSMKQTGYSMDQLLPSRTFTPEEIAILREKEPRLDGRGKVGERNARLQSEANLRFAFDALKRPFRSGHKLPAKGPDWVTYRQALLIRHRLTHPKEAKDVTVTEEEYAGEFDGDLVLVRSDLQGRS